MNARDALRAARERAFWLEKAPGLHIGELGASAHAGALDVREEKQRLETAGWSRFDRLVPAEDARRLAEGIRCLHDANIPTPFLYVFDEPWAITTRGRFTPTFAALMGATPRVLPDAWAWYVVEGRGWAPHRGVTERGTELLNVWIALSDVGEESACMHVVPLDRDPHWPGALERVDVDPARAVALPVPAGSVLAWNANVLHWGGEMKPGAPPRVSMSFTLAPGAPTEPPAFEERIDLVADMLLAYREPAGVSGPWLEWARLWSGMRAVRR